ncbi:Zn(2)-C6 fungal-type domain-containing protein [Fusarium keratoplasticum]|uniref:Zn(2)-C6 fungal-type domain-containing protein n=1 Tax=Fusarium keratoplasticum TaxID=1328300 RepID=A0ACC0QQL8_9HYPO|nr:Zn(2)-C6 fungal-type domain-containing protein [Fusarium keratoplasticum]KAI8660916.1 Zn(2)-C6 fungal-type domain-containing protein [Fusarium keratoplasticum]
MTMAETVIRKACDRCHAQKLSCKRYNDEPCERCVRLKTECKSSPSLRYRKQQQQQQQQLVDNNSNHLQGQLPPTSSTPAPTGRRSPKRRRTDSQGDASLVPPDAAVPIVPHTGVLAAASKSHVPVTPDPVLDAGDFGFTFDQLAFFPQHLSHPELPGGVVNDPHLVHPPAVFADSWDPRLAVEAYQPPQEPLPPQLQGDASHRVVDSVPSAVPPPQLQLQPLRSRSCVPEHGSSDKRSRPRTKQRPRQITLRHDADHLSPLHPEAPPIHWMAQLSDINARLLDLASALPSPQEVAQSGPSLGRPADERFRSQGFPIEDMFKLTRRVADILEKPPADTPDRDGARGHHSTIDGTDPGNAMFILSTYVRLLDMYQRVFSLVHAELSRADSGATFSFWKLPAVTVGSFAVESSPFLQMFLTIQLAEEFLCRLRGSTARWSGAGNAASMFAGVVDVSFQAFRDREEALAKHLVKLRSEIEPLLDS